MLNSIRWLQSVLKADASSHRCVMHLMLASQQQQQQQEEAPAQPSSTEPAGQPKVLREFRAFGGKVLETDEKLTGPEDQPDFWEGEKFDVSGGSGTLVVTVLTELTASHRVHQLHPIGSAQFLMELGAEPGCHMTLSCETGRPPRLPI